MIARVIGTLQRVANAFFYAWDLAKIHRGMAEIGEHDTGEVEIEDGHCKASDQKGEIAACTEERARRDASRHRFREIEDRESGFRKVARGEESLCDRYEEDSR